MLSSPRQLRSTSRQSSGSKKSDDEGEVKQEGESSPARCPICLAMPENKAKSEACSHFFCYSCLKEWSKVKAECPLCKMPIRTIYYNIKSDVEFDEYHVKRPWNEFNINERLPRTNMLDIESFDNWWHFRMREYRHQLRRRRENELAAMQACSDITVIRKRRMYYWNKSKVVSVKSGRRVREISPRFFRENPGQMHRLEPWLKRELTVLFGAHNRHLISRVRDIVMSAVPNSGMESNDLYQRIHPYLLDRTQQFIHEFVHFAKSPYTVQQYDKYAVYPTQTQATEGQSRTSDNGATSRQNRPSRNPLRSRWDESPEPAGQSSMQSSQSAMLSRTSWGEDMGPLYPEMNRPRATLPTMSSRVIGPHDVTPPRDNFEYRNPTPPRDIPLSITSSLFTGVTRNCLLAGRRQPYSHMTSHSIDVEAPLNHQTLPAQATHMRDYRLDLSSMEMTRRRHTFRLNPWISQPSYMRRGLRHYAFPGALPAPIQSNPADVIVISSDSSDVENNTSTTESNTLHYRPGAHVSHRQADTRTQKIKEEKVADSSNSDSSSSSSDGSGVEFVSYIKPRHLRTPDAFINLDSSGDEKPGPSSSRDVTKHEDVKMQSHIVSSASSSDSSSSEDDQRSRKGRNPRKKSVPQKKFRSNDVLERTRRFLNRVRSSEDHSTVYNAESPPPNHSHFSRHGDSPLIDVTSEFTPSSPFYDTGDPGASTNGSSSQIVPKSTPKKIFERGRVLVNLDIGRKKRFSSNSSVSDYEIDVVTEDAVFGTFNSPKYSETSSRISRNSQDSVLDGVNLGELATGRKHSVSNHSMTSGQSSERKERSASLTSSVKCSESRVSREKSSREFDGELSKKSRKRHRRRSRSRSSRHKRKKHHHHRSRERSKNRDGSGHDKRNHNDFGTLHGSHRHKKSKKHRRSRSSSLELISYFNKD